LNNNLEEVNTKSTSLTILATAVLPTVIISIPYLKPVLEQNNNINNKGDDTKNFRKFLKCPFDGNKGSTLKNTYQMSYTVSSLNFY
jgi:hypothetical protein